LVADDQVVLLLRPDGHVDGRAPSLLRYHLEVRGIGVINIRDLFGATAVREIKTVELVVELSDWQDGVEYERIGLDHETYTMLGTSVPMLRVPVRPGRNMGVILEVAARNHLLKMSGEHPVRKFLDSLNQGLNPAEEQ
jgi:HPr kinase/phosphorylase